MRVLQMFWNVVKVAAFFEAYGQCACMTSATRL